VAGYNPPAEPPPLALSDRWILSRTQRLIQQATDYFHDYEFAAAKNKIEVFFRKTLADNYLEMCKLPLYEENSAGARYTLHAVLLTVLKLFAPILPHVTEEIYQTLFAADDAASIHRADWPAANKALIDKLAETAGDAIVDIATAVRRFKTENQLHLSAEIERLQVTVQDAALRQALSQASADIRSVSRATRVEVRERLDDELKIIKDTGLIAIALAEQPLTKEEEL
jgi:valyl-tRNA synthetase